MYNVTVGQTRFEYPGRDSASKVPFGALGTLDRVDPSDRHLPYRVS